MWELFFLQHNLASAVRCRGEAGTGAAINDEVDMKKKHSQESHRGKSVETDDAYGYSHTVIS